MTWELLTLFIALGCVVTVFLFGYSAGHARGLSYGAQCAERLIAILKDDIARLRAGDFTEEEFQNLCHNFSEDDEQRFEEGCTQYRKKLFGVK